MQKLRILPIFALLPLSLCIGCSPDHSSDTQQMPVASKPSAETSVPTQNLPPAAKAALEKAAKGPAATK